MCDATDTFLEGVWAWGLDYWVSEVVPLIDGSGKKTILNVNSMWSNQHESEKSATK